MGHEDKQRKTKFKKGDIAISRKTGSIVFIMRVYEDEEFLRNEGILFKPSSSYSMHYSDEELDYPPDYVKEAMKLIDPEIVDRLADRARYDQITEEYGW